MPEYAEFGRRERVRHVENDGTSLPEPAVPPDTYDESYYRTSCAGYEEWVASGGSRPAELYAGILHLAGFEGGTLVDIGSGRGELVAVAAARGADRAIGVDYSEDAVRMAERTLQVHGVEGTAEIRHADARSLPVADATADLITLVDVVEHLSPQELATVLREAWRVARPGGRVFIHTLPNRNLYEFTYRLHRALARLVGQRWPAEPRNRYELEMHVNEQTPRRLRRALRRAAFVQVHVTRGQWIHSDHIPDPRHARLYRRIARVPFLRRLVIADLFASATRPHRG